MKAHKPKVDVGGEVSKIQAHLGWAPSGTEYRTTMMAARACLLKGDFQWDGWYCRPKAKHIGAGVYAVTVSKRTAGGESDTPKGL